MEKMQVFVKSFGCSTNLADGEVLAGCLEKAGYKLTHSLEAADVVIYNTCAVKGPTENRMIEILKNIASNKKVIVAGCLALINMERLRKEVRFDGVVGPAANCRITEVVERVLNGEKVVLLESDVTAKPSLDMPVQRLNPVVSIVPVNYGCLGSCAYCCVVFARGHLRSFSVEEIVERFKRDLSLGVREFWVTSQDTACYGRDLDTNLVKLLNAICNLEGEFKIRVGMMNPNMLADILDDLIQAFKNDKIFKFIHLPVQCGDDQILGLMRRFYSVKDFTSIVEAFRINFPEITLATDVICGFPGESEEAFKRTLQLVEKVRPDIVNVSKFFARPKTAAAAMLNDFVPHKEIKRRSSIAAEVARKIAFEKNQQWVDCTGDILVDEVGKIAGSWVGRNFAYKPVVINETGNMLGKTLHVKIVNAFPTYLEGKITK